MTKSTAAFTEHTSRKNQFRPTTCAKCRSCLTCQTFCCLTKTAGPLSSPYCFCREPTNSLPEPPGVLLAICGLLVNDTDLVGCPRPNGEDAPFCPWVPDEDAVAYMMGVLGSDAAARGMRFGADAYLPTTSPCKEYDPDNLHPQELVLKLNRESRHLMAWH